MVKRGITREQYKAFKRMDHKQIENFITNLYNEGYENGKEAAGKRVKPSDIAVAIMDVPGIGTKKVADIMGAINKLYDGSYKQTKEVVRKRGEAD